MQTCKGKEDKKGLGRIKKIKTKILRSANYRYTFPLRQGGGKHWRSFLFWKKKEEDVDCDREQGFSQQKREGRISLELLWRVCFWCSAGWWAYLKRISEEGISTMTNTNNEKKLFPLNCWVCVLLVLLRSASTFQLAAFKLGSSDMSAPKGSPRGRVCK